MTPYKHGLDHAVRHRLPVLVWAGWLVVTLTSCGGEGDESGKPGEAGASKADPVAEEAENSLIFDLQDEVDDLLTEAQKSGMKKVDPTGFSRIEKRISDAEAAYDAGEETSAKTKLVLAKNALESFLEERDRALKAVEDLAELREKVDAAKKKAEETEASVYAVNLYKQATEAYDEAQTALKEALSVDDVAMAERNLQQAEVVFGQAAMMAAENKALRGQAEEAKKQLAEWKKRAEDMGAKEKAAPQWLDASTAESNADAVFARGEFQMALNAYQDALRRYGDVIATIQQQEQMAKAMEDTRKAHEAYAAQQAAEAGGQQPGAEAAMVDPSDPVAPPPGGLVTDPAEAMKGLDMTPGGPETATPQLSSITVVDGFDPTQYPQEIDADDEAFLQLHYKKLTDSGKLEYDPMSGAATIDYTAVDDVKQDLIKASPASIVEYKHPFQQQPTVGLPGQPVPRQRAQTPFSFAGNTQGFVLFPIPFKYYVRMEYYLDVLTMDMKGTFAATVMYDASKRAGFAAQWLSIGVMQGATPKVGGAPPPYNQVADRWFDKTRPIPMKVEFQMPDPRKGGAALRSGLFTVTYDVGADKEAVNAVSSKKYTEGMVGFHWSRTKFEVKNLVITGILDKETAVTILRKKLNMPKEKTSTSSRATGGEGQATTARKIGGNFDF